MSNNNQNIFLYACASLLKMECNDVLTPFILSIIDNKEDFSNDFRYQQLINENILNKIANTEYEEYEVIPRKTICYTYNIKLDNINKDVLFTVKWKNKTVYGITNKFIFTDYEFCNDEQLNQQLYKQWKEIKEIGDFALQEFSDFNDQFEYIDNWMIYKKLSILEDFQNKSKAEQFKDFWYWFCEEEDFKEENDDNKKLYLECQYFNQQLNNAAEIVDIEEYVEYIE